MRTYATGADEPVRYNDGSAERLAGRLSRRDAGGSWRRFGGPLLVLLWQVTGPHVECGRLEGHTMLDGGSGCANAWCATSLEWGVGIQLCCCWETVE